MPGSGPKTVVLVYTQIGCTGSDQSPSIVLKEASYVHITSGNVVIA